MNYFFQQEIIKLYLILSNLIYQETELLRYFLLICVIISVSNTRPCWKSESSNFLCFLSALSERTDSRRMNGV